MNTNYKNIHFEKKSNRAKTSVWSCHHVGGEYVLGEVKWCIGWRQYAYFPVNHPIFIHATYSSGCLKDIADFIEQLMAERKAPQ